MFSLTQEQKEWQDVHTASENNCSAICVVIDTCIWLEVVQYFIVKIDAVITQMQI